MFPYPSKLRHPVAISRPIIRALLQTAATFGHSEQPGHYWHIPPHSYATAKLSRSFAAALTRADPALGGRPDEIEIGAHFHDIGKYLIPESILLKPGPLTAE